MFDKNFRRLNRQFDRIHRSIPISRGFLNWVRKPESRILRIPLGILLLLGGVFSFLPILGVWMLPLGLLLLARDAPPVVRVANPMLRWVDRKLPERT